MKLTLMTVKIAMLAGQASAHYIFEYLNSYPQYEYIRRNTDYNSPVTNLSAPELRCNVGGNNGTGTDTVTMAAGSLVKFTADVALYHQGPVSFYIAKAPTTAALFDGSGTVWYKIKDIGPTFDSSGTATWDLEQSYNVTLPSCLAAGQYLLRIQQLAIHNPYPYGIPQFYINCAQINVTGGGSGLRGTAVAIPGAFHATDPGYTVNIYNNFHNYTVPGPAVATC